MDNRTLIAFGMVLGVVIAALFKRAMTPQDVKEILISIISGTIGFTIPSRAASAAPPAAKAGAAGAAILLVIGTSLLFTHGCGHGTPPDPNDPTALPPVVTLPKDPLAPTFTPFYRHTDGGIQ